MPQGKHDVATVKYIGIAKIRRITEEEWRGAGVKDQSGVEWNELNGYTIDGSHFNADAIKALEPDDAIALLRKGEETENEG